LPGMAAVAIGVGMICCAVGGLRQIPGSAHGGRIWGRARRFRGPARVGRVFSLGAGCGVTG
jgi:hypothetical protein